MAAPGFRNATDVNRFSAKRFHSGNTAAERRAAERGGSAISSGYLLEL